jgi:hypothetical protein
MKGKKTGGRKKGTQNKVTKDLRQRITDLLEKNFERIESDFNKLGSEKRLIVLEKYLKYCLPPLQSLNVQAEIRSQLETLTDDQLTDLAEKIISLNK